MSHVARPLIRVIEAAAAVCALPRAQGTPEFNAALANLAVELAACDTHGVLRDHASSEREACARAALDVLGQHSADETEVWAAINEAAKRIRARGGR